MGIRTALSTAAFGVLLLGCESLPGRSALTETKWEVVSLNGKAPIQTRQPLTAELLPNGTLKGFGGVNRFEIQVEIHGKRFSTGGEVTSTLIGSTVPAFAEQESAYITAIARTRSCFVSDEDLLHLCGANGNELVTLKRVDR